VGADVDGAQATFDNGVLNIRLPKTGESEGRKLEIS
jgi:HSP20 family molecular chaperone IbpA